MICRVWTQNGKMAFNYLDKDRYDEATFRERDHLVSIINGDIKGEFADVKVSPDDEGVIQINGHPTILMRGWGMLTAGRNGLSCKEAARIQDQFRDYIIDRLLGK